MKSNIGNLFFAFPLHNHLKKMSLLLLVRYINQQLIVSFISWKTVTVPINNSLTNIIIIIMCQSRVSGVGPPVDFFQLSLPGRRGIYEDFSPSTKTNKRVAEERHILLSGTDGLV